MTRPRITVVGSLNMDLVVRCAELPRPGETVMASDTAEVCGGKGANQAVAAARAGAEVAMIGRVGEDAFAERLLSNLQEDGVDVKGVRRTKGCASGIAVVAVEESGENAILVSPGANGRLTPDDVARARAVIAASDALLLQLEVPMATVLAALTLAKSAGVRVFVDPAPAPRQCPAELLGADVLCPNEAEAAALVERSLHSDEEIEAAARELGAAGATVAITLGERGVALWNGGELQWIPSFQIAVCDTTAAGDAFAGAMATRWAEGAPLAEAVRCGNAAGALAASRQGAQPSLPHRGEIEQFLAERRAAGSH